MQAIPKIHPIGNNAKQVPSHFSPPPHEGRGAGQYEVHPSLGLHSSSAVLLAGYRFQEKTDV